VIEFTQGNLLEADVEALVNTVNTVGVMGKGIALQFKQAYPENFKAYERACKAGEVELGRMFVWHSDRLGNPRMIINFPTKRHWRAKSRLKDVQAGLDALRAMLGKEGVKSLAVPPLGCGHGGLAWSDVRPLIVSALGDLDGTDVVVFEPAGAPSVEAMPVGTARPGLTLNRAALLAVFQRYLEGSWGKTVGRLEAQKLAYFLQEAGQELRLDFGRHRYGPYAETLNHVLQRMEGHQLRGYGDRSEGTPSRMTLVAGAPAEIERALQDDPSASERIDRVARLVEGYDTPYGLELLATVHWVGTGRDGQQAADSTLVEAVHAWSERKRQRYVQGHIESAWEHLAEHGWGR
jgi:O-acetyl-ADP-ribose deacetylase (regulator of RNase III)